MNEPTIAVGLIDGADEITIELPDGERTFTAADAGWSLALEAEERFSLLATIGIDFHWQQQEEQHFSGALRILARPDGRITLVNDVPLETYLTSVTCSEMSAAMPPELVKAHAIISRSWLIAQLEARRAKPQTAPGLLAGGEEYIGWTDREAHDLFDVCADDHCQRYQGLGRVANQAVAELVATTRGVVLMYAGAVCDARFSKCCGGVSEDFVSAWGDQPVPYLVPVFDGEGDLPIPPLTEEAAMRDFVEHPPSCWCNCSDQAVLGAILNDYDQRTPDFFRWRRRLDGAQISAWVRDKLGPELGVVTALEPLTRGASGRITRLRLVGTQASLVVGKELTIRRVLSDSHLLSSAFVVDREADQLVLSGAGWGHGVGLCQIGAGAMAAAGRSCDEILSLYYPAASLQLRYSEIS